MASLTNLECLCYQRPELHQGDMLVQPAAACSGQVCEAARANSPIKNMTVVTTVVTIYDIPIIAIKNLLDNPGEYPVLPVESGALCNMATEHCL